jgi:HK97 family phage portal protein
VFGLLKKSAVYTLDQLATGLVGWMGWGTASGQTITDATSVDVPAVFCAARVIAEGMAQVPVRIRRREMRAGRVYKVDDEDHWAHRLLAVRPNEWQTSYEFREGMAFNAALGRGAIAIKVMAGDGRVLELLPVPAGSWTVEQRPNWALRFRVDYADKTHGYFSREEVFYLRGPSINGFEALPAIRQAREAIGLSKALEAQQAKLAGNGGKPSGILAFKQSLRPETREKLRETWQDRFGPNGQGGVAILDADATFQSMTMTSVDAQHIENRRFQIEEIARAFRIHPLMLMQADKTATFASAEQMFRTHVIHTLGPWFRRFEESAHRDILAYDAERSCDLMERGLMRGDFTAEADYYTKALGAGGTPAWMTQNEVREERGMNPHDDPKADMLSTGAMNQAQMAGKTEGYGND